MQERVILLAGRGVLALLGLGRVAKKDLQGNARRNAFVVVAVGLLLVSVPLAITTATVARETLTEFQVAEIARSWASESEYEVRRVDVKGDVVSVQITGEGDPPQTTDLASAVQEKVRQPVMLEIESDRVDIERVDVVPTDD